MREKYESLSVSVLRELAKSRGIKGTSGMKKANLVEAMLAKDEEEAAALMGANGFTIFFKITLPNIKWSLIYGIILCTSRALGEFGAVNALSKTRGETFTLPLEIDALYMSGTDTSITSAFAVSSILVIIAIIVLVLRNIFEHRQSDYKKGGQK